MKTCTKCGVAKPATPEFFHRMKGQPDGLRPDCKPCKNAALRAARSADPEFRAKQYRQRKSLWAKSGRDAFNACARRASANYRARNPEKVVADHAIWRANNRNKVAGYARKSGSSRGTRAPDWLDKAHREQMAAIYAEARRMTEETGVPHEVDHIIPLQGETVSGLHVPWNLQVLPASENRSKGNRVTGEKIAVSISS